MALALKEPKTSIVSGGRKKIHSIFVDGSEMVEEFDVVTDEILLRKLRKPNPLGGEGEWIVELGGEAARAVRNVDREMLAEVVGAPQVVSQDAPDKHVFRIRNLPYPKDVYTVTVEFDGPKSLGEIVVRTSNKKYFKKLPVQEMVRLGLTLDKDALSWSYNNHTLMIEYKKHLAVRAKEAAEKKERAAIQSVRLKDSGEPQCAQQ
jgi:hypothetical protein